MFSTQYLYFLNPAFTTFFASSFAEKIVYIKPQQWDTLPQNDLRFIYSEHQEEDNLHQVLVKKGLMLDLNGLLAEVG